MSTCGHCGVRIPKGRQFCAKCDTWSAAPDAFLPDGTPLYLKTKNPQYASLQLELYDQLLNYKRSMEEDEQMIRIDVEEYCQQCLDFEPDVTKPERYYAAGKELPLHTDTIIQCKYRKRCAAIKRYLEQQAKGES